MARLSTSFEDGIRYFDESPNVPDVEKTFVLLHGLGTSLAFWTSVAPSLVEKTRTIALDLPGFGRSRRPHGRFDLPGIAAEVLDFVRLRRVTDAIVVGHSLGAVVAMEMARQRPDIVKSLVLVDGTLLTANEAMKDPLSAARHPIITVSVAAQFIGGAIPMADWLLDVLAASPAVRLVTLWPFVASPVSVRTNLLRDALIDNAGTGILSTLKALNGINIKALMAAVEQPVDLIWGKADRLMDDDDIKASRGLLNVNREQSIADCGHWPMVERPERLVEFLVRGCS